MLEGTMLRAKTESSEGAYRRELRELGRLRSLESQSLSRVREKERSFWCEVSRSSEAHSRGAAHTPVRAEERLVQAHRELKEAIEAHGAARKGREEGSVRSVRAEAMASTCRSMLNVERRREASRREGFQGEEVAEVAALLRARLGTSNTGPHRVAGRNSHASMDMPVDRLGLVCDAAGVAGGGLGEGRRCGEPLQARMPAQSNGILSSSNVPVTHTLRCGVLQVEAARVETSAQGASLSLECSSLSRTGPVRIVVATGGREGLQVTITVQPGESLSALVRERSQIIARLSAVGIRVGRVAIEADTNSAVPAQSIDSRPQRRRRGSEDEDRIA